MNEWIPIEEKLPQEGEHVIGYCKREMGDKFHVEPLLYERYWVFLTGCNEGYGYADTVTHWMPLPAPPEKERESF